MRRIGRSQRRRVERGAVAIMVALSMVGLCLAAALVIDLGLLRVDRQQNKATSDASVMAGTDALVPDVTAPTFNPYAAVCRAKAYLQVNDPDLATFLGSPVWEDGNGNPISTPDCANPPTTPCDESSVNRSSWVRFTGRTSEGVAVRIQSGYLVTDGSWPEEALVPNSDVSSYNGCDQVAVMLTQNRQSTLGTLSADDFGSGIRSVGRVTVTPGSTPFSLLVLERDACAALAITSGGAEGRIDVFGYDDPADDSLDRPGVIHVDSDGLNPDGSSGSQCNAKPIIEGKNPGACDDGDPGTPCGGIVAHESANGGIPGQFTVSATSNTSDGVPRVMTEPYPPGGDPTYAEMMTRALPDNVYLNGITDVVNTEAGPLARIAATGVVPDPSTWTTVGCNPSNSVAGTHVLVNCPNFNDDTDFPAANTVVFRGQVSANIINMPQVEYVYAVGGTSPAGISVGDRFAMNNGGADSCPQTAAGNSRRARLFLGTGALKTAGGSTFIACSTTVILLGGDTSRLSDADPATTGGGCLPSTTPTYTDDPCPTPNLDGTGFLDMSGNGTIEWTGASTLDDLNPSLADQDDRDDLEDLALWTESYGVHNVGGGGYMHLSGVFVAPNAIPFKINGGATQDVENSQYVVRRLWSTGNGTLTMRPLPSLPLSPPNVFSTLVR